ncbi:MAG: hypothetical protein KF901_11550 [Myxococcales bacterium]|nr:hypothetical protein [Myxococcales bacterium]
MRWWIACLLCLGLACESGGSGARLVEVELVAEPRGIDVRHSVVGEWEVELEEASVLVGPIYLLAPPATPLMAHLRSLFVSTARAHAGDDNLDGIRVIGELLDPVPVNALMDAPIPLGLTLAEGVELDRIVLVLDTPRGAHAAPDSPTRGHHAFVRGVATRGDRTLRFSAGLDLPNDRIARRIEGLRFPSPVVLDDGSRVVVRPSPNEWLRRVDFDALADALVDLPADEEAYIEAPSQLHNAWYLGLRNPSSWETQVVAR